MYYKAVKISEANISLIIYNQLKCHLDRYLWHTVVDRPCQTIYGYEQVSFKSSHKENINILIWILLCSFNTIICMWEDYVSF